MIVTIIGTGYVGLVTGACLASKGHTVRCVDVSAERIRQIRAGRAPFYEPGLEDLLRAGLASGRLSATIDLATAIGGSELSLIAVGTPAKGADDSPDLSFIETAAAQIGAELRRSLRYHVVTVKSTVVPGTTRNLVKPILERASGRGPGEFGLCMNPEFLREGSAVHDFQNPDRIVIGQADETAGDVLEELYAPYLCPKLRVSLEEAELTKYASNCLLSVLISFSNELAGLCEATPGADVETVMEALYHDRRFSTDVGQASACQAPEGHRIRPEILSYLRAGIGFGGSCLPKDVNALRAYGRRARVATPLLDAAMTTNHNRPAQIVKMAETALGSLDAKRVALLGLAFKNGTDDLRSSPALSILHALESRGATVKAYDPVVSRDAAARAGVNGAYSHSLANALNHADAALITTADPAYRIADWSKLAARMRTPVIIDGRNVLRRVPLPPPIRYYQVGQAVSSEF